MSTAADVRADLARRANPDDAANYSRFFQTQPGGYGEGDVFIGVRVPAVREVCKGHRDLPLAEIRDLLDDVQHEHRLAALITAVEQYKRAGKQRSLDPDHQGRLHLLYLDALASNCVDNWDLVDTSTEWLLGDYVRQTHDSVALLNEYVSDHDPWRRRAGIVATYAFIKAGDPEPVFAAAIHVASDRRDLIQKATGWMLREVGKRISQLTLIDFLDEYADRLGRTCLSYAIEHLDAETRVRLRAL